MPERPARRAPAHRQRRVYEGYDPIAAYLIGREREIDAARLILAAHTNHIAGDRAQERLRALYV